VSESVLLLLAVFVDRNKRNDRKTSPFCSYMSHKQQRKSCEDDAFCSKKKAWCGNKEEITLIWLTRTKLHIENNEGENILKHLYEINNFVVTFDESFACIKYMKSIKDERIFLIVDGKLIVQLYEEIRSCDALDSIYIFCLHHEKYEHLRNRPKIAGFFLFDLSINTNKFFL
jgi:hypothetical protein